jgi:hypothetical protein
MNSCIQIHLLGLKENWISSFQNTCTLLTTLLLLLFSLGLGESKGGELENE